MRRAALVAAVAVVVGVGWAPMAVVSGGEGGEELSAARPARSAERSEETITPPPPLPEVEIPAILPVGKDPFSAREPLPAPERGIPLLAEGKRLFNREGRLEVDEEGQSILVLDDDDIPPMRLLENSWREFLESRTKGGKQEARWRISGLVTRYSARNYLLLNKVVRIMPEEEGL